MNLVEKYPHLPFTKNWELSLKTQNELSQCETLVQCFQKLPVMYEDQKRLNALSLRKGVQATVAIEGNTLTEKEIQLIIEGKSIKSESKEYQEKEVNNITDAYNLITEAIDDENKQLIRSELLCAIHREVGKGLGEYFEAIPGQIRQNNVLVGRYRPPDYADLPELIKRYCQFLRTEFWFEHEPQNFQNVVLEAIVAHVYLELIHPFGDGNGRVGRLLEHYILYRGGLPYFCTHILANHYNDTRREYYANLEKASTQRSLSPFIAYAIRGFYEGLQEAFETVIDSVWETTWKQYVYKVFDDAIEKFPRRDARNRKRYLALLLPRDMPFNLANFHLLTERISALYLTASAKTRKRDLEDLYDLQLIKKIEESTDKSTDYYIRNSAILLPHYGVN